MGNSYEVQQHSCFSVYMLEEKKENYLVFQQYKTYTHPVEGKYDVLGCVCLCLSVDEMGLTLCNEGRRKENGNIV